jgi:PUA domain protein
MENPFSSNTLMGQFTRLYELYTNVCLKRAEPGLVLTVYTTDPFVLPAVGIDRGAIRFLLQGAHMMCPGMTSKGGYLPPAESELAVGTPVALHAEGKEHAVGIGILKLSTEEIKSVNKNIGVETITYLGDDLWQAQKL